ncbi:LacI family DNA-binding transcriptional regulator [Candidimonas sp. SYP-B2681]|uniref:LacI family DNA-binding transcriptional regulator n=1 Tax=Candidimonas sp. SYP-B2681 TaxID=2497686 RepID=UPI000F885201|nr:LacI family DNA-binding transcriptional regulator [Candidimonas sp. SYP-B2681]RTZ41694.1 LacI family DNA-binding transcriptional regulator [Candidimonas sp. SYP-B2681]
MKDKQQSGRTSILDIAERAGVSPATVSRVFNSPHIVSDATRNLVMGVAKQSQYRPNASARTLRTRRSRAIGVVLPTLTNPVFAECLQGIAWAAAMANYAIMLQTTGYQLDQEEGAVANLQASGVDGMVLVVSDAAKSKAIQQIQAAGTPYVLVYNRHSKHPCISVAGDDAMLELTHALVRLGHRRITMVCGRLAASDRAQQRYDGFVSAMEQANLTPSALIEVPFIETAIDEISAVLQAGNRPTALVCSNDLIAIRAIRAAKLCGLRVPDDISISGFDGIQLGADMTPALSTVAQPNAEMGQRSVALLVQGLEQENPPAAASSITLPYTLHWGESCGPAPIDVCPSS